MARRATSGALREDAGSVATPVTRPPLKWAGGKRWQVPHIRPLWQPHATRRLVEPFCGGLAVAIGLSPRRALLNDANPHLINFYLWLKRGLDVSVPMVNQERLFYRHRRRFNSLLASGGADTPEAAELFYYLNRTGYNGLCRFNSRGEFNVPFGRYKTIGYAVAFDAYPDAFEHWTFTAGDVEDVPLEASDFVYADPPYDVEFTHYSKGGFTWDDQERTAVWLSRHRGPVVLVNQLTDRIEKLYRRLGFAVDYLDAPRRISCTGDRTPAREIIGTRNL
jgi:DNA adenine methylase